jgi:uncharacterized phage protein (TIGR02218 family)
MTTRPGNNALQILAGTRSKRHANLVAVHRRDGTVMRLTDHDCVLEHGGYEWRPTRAAAMSAERREAGLRSSNQEAYGILDGLEVRVPDLQGDLYSGAMVENIVVDWAMPWVAFARHRKWIVEIEWEGSKWKATLDGRASQMQQRTGGRFGGAFTRTCPYQLGGQFCGVDMAVDAGFAHAGARVASIEVPAMIVAFDAATWPGTYEDDWFRDGEIQWLWAAADESGTATATTTLTTLTDSSKTWTPDEHVGKYVMMLTGAGGPVIDGSSYAIITANTADTLTFAGGVGATHAIGTHYDISPPCANAGMASPIAGYQHGTRRVSLLIPTAFPIAVGDGGIYRAGCDGLKGTCKTKFSNLDRFGGDPFAPSVAEILEPPRG